MFLRLNRVTTKAEFGVSEEGRTKKRDVIVAGADLRVRADTVEGYVRHQERPDGLFTTMLERQVWGRIEVWQTVEELDEVLK